MPVVRAQFLKENWTGTPVFSQTEMSSATNGWDVLFLFPLRSPLLCHKDFSDILPKTKVTFACHQQLSTTKFPNRARKQWNHKVHMTTSPWLYFNQCCYSHLLRFLLHALLFFPCRGGGGRSEIRPHIQIQASTLHPQPPVPPPSVHVPLPATPQQQGPEPLPRSQSITAERVKETEKGSKRRGKRMRWKGVRGGGVWKRRGEEKRKWDAMKLNHRKGRVGQRRGTD